MTEVAPGIVTDDGAGLAEFYSNGLGFSVTDMFEFPQGVVRRLRRDGASVKLFEPAGGADVAPAKEPWHQHRGYAYAAIYVEDAEATVSAAVEAGAALLTPVTSHRPGARMAFIADPQGNMWEILEESG